MKIQKIINSIAQENTYLLSNDKACMVIDPGSNPEQLLSELENLNLPLVAILLTHAHFDHIMGLESLKTFAPQATIYLHEAERAWPKAPELNASRLLLHQDVIAPDADLFYGVDRKSEIKGFSFHVLETPGHSIGGVSLYFPDDELVFTGDALFKEAIGRWDLPTGNYESLRESIKTKLFTLPDHIQIFPGHGQATQIGYEKANNPFFRH
ncbi:MBL fold metallo-hydrolase [Lactococcus sp.]|uniref:MBL fold metallo-hydrolase n=1 Tax=Lactococcus sp. TaxID=44273 RepID=UPI0035AEAC68